MRETRQTAQNIKRESKTLTGAGAGGERCSQRAAGERARKAWRASSNTQLAKGLETKSNMGGKGYVSLEIVKRQKVNKGRIESLILN